MLNWLDKFTSEPKQRDNYINGIAWYWAEEVLRRLELDKRYDVTWIESYRRKEGDVN
jgi:hypothetical protein